MDQIRRVAQHAVLYSRASQELQARWQQSVLGPESRFDIDAAAARFTLSSPTARIEARCQVVASIASSPATLLWGFAPMFRDYPALSAAAGYIREFGQRHQLAQFTTEEIPYPVDPSRDQQAVIADVSHQIGQAAIEIFGSGYTYYSAPTTHTRLVYLLDQWSVAPPEVDLEAVLVPLGRLVQDCDDLGWSLDGLVRLRPGWALTEEQPQHGGQQRWRIFDERRRSITLEVTRDQSGRLTNVQASGVHGPDGATAG